MTEITLSSNNRYQEPHEIQFTSIVSYREIETLKNMIAKYDWSCGVFQDGWTTKEPKVFKKNRRANDTWVSSDCIFADYDDGYTISQFEIDNADYEYIIATSRNHQKPKNDKPPCDRFHVIYPLGKTFYDFKVYSNLLQALHIKYNGIIDSACKDPSRHVLANENTQVFYHPGVSILDTLESIQIPKPEYPTITYSSKRTNNSALRNAMRLALMRAAKDDYLKDYNLWIGVGWTMRAHGFDVEDFMNISNDPEKAKEKWELFDLSKGNSSFEFLLHICYKYGMQARP